MKSIILVAIAAIATFAAAKDIATVDCDVQHFQDKITIETKSIQLKVTDQMDPDAMVAAIGEVGGYKISAMAFPSESQLTQVTINSATTSSEHYGDENGIFAAMSDLTTKVGVFASCSYNPIR